MLDFEWTKTIARACLEGADEVDAFTRENSQLLWRRSFFKALATDTSSEYAIYRVASSYDVESFPNVVEKVVDGCMS